LKKQSKSRWSTILVSVIAVVIVIGCGTMRKPVEAAASDRFEQIRAYIQTWLSKVNIDKLIMSSSYLKEKIVDDWGNQRDKYQIVSVRNPDDYNSAGHIPNAINIYWIDILKDESLARLDSKKKLVIYCYYGHASMLSYTILSLLGYSCYSLDFGMMDWNLDALVKQPWDQEADYAVETKVNRSKEAYLPPVIESKQGDARDMVKEMAIKYFSGEGSPVIPSTDVKAIIDDWEHKKVEYQIVDVRSKRDYETGHVPFSIHIPWAKIAERENLKKLDPSRTVIVYSENGQTGQLATTVLSLLGYHAVDMKFGMMDWNKAYVDKSKQWDGVAGYPVEKGN
jgi:rhodanese-related sulfurtransferase